MGLNSGTMKVVNLRDRRWPLSVAALWASAWLVGAFIYHVNQPIGELTVTIGGHTYTGDPPALTLYQSDAAAVLVLTAVVATALLAVLVDVAVRRRRNYEGVGVASVIVGGLLLVFSLFGLLWGVASFGVVGALLLLASRPVSVTART